MSGASTSPSSRARYWKVAAVLAVALLLLTAHFLGILARFAAPAELARTLLQLGLLGYLAFILAYTVLQPFGVPGTVFIVAAPLIWPWPVAFGLSMVGTMLASIVGFSFARFVARDLVTRFIPARFRKYDEALATRAFSTVFFLRLVFWMPPLLHAFFGVSKVSFATHFWGSLLGYLLPLFLVSYFGERMFDALKGAPLQVWLALAAASLAFLLALWLGKRYFALRRARALRE